MDVFGTMEVIEYFPAFWKGFHHGAPEPVGTIAKQGNPNALLRNPRSDDCKVDGELLGVLNLMPTGYLDNPFFAVKEIDPEPLYLSPFASAAFAAAPTLRSGRRV